MTDIAETLRLHALRLRNDPNGKRADLSKADLSGADLSGADLRMADLREADLSKADLSMADLSGATLRGATLREADLSMATLRMATLRGADLSMATLRGADLRMADLREATLIVAGQDARGYLFYAYQTDDGGVEMRAGCRRMSLPDAIVHWSQAHGDDPALQADCLSLVRRIEAMARVRGWIAEVQS